LGGPFGTDMLIKKRCIRLCDIYTELLIFTESTVVRVDDGDVGCGIARVL